MSSSYTTCAACKFFDRECVEDCVFYPYFPPDNPKRFISVCLAFGASNVAKFINELSPSQCGKAIDSLVDEAGARLRDPVTGSYGVVSLLQYQRKEDQTALSNAKKELAKMIGSEVVSSLLLPSEHVGDPDPSSLVPRQHDKTPMVGHPTDAELQQQVEKVPTEKLNDVQTDLSYHSQAAHPLQEQQGPPQKQNQPLVRLEMMSKSIKSEDPLTFPTNPSSSSSPITVADQLDSHLLGPASHIGSASGSYSNEGLLDSDRASPSNIDVEQKKFQELAKGETALGGSTKEVTETQINENTTASSHGNVSDSCTERKEDQTALSNANKELAKMIGSEVVSSLLLHPEHGGDPDPSSLVPRQHGKMPMVGNPTDAELQQQVENWLTEKLNEVQTDLSHHSQAAHPLQEQQGPPQQQTQPLVPSLEMMSKRIESEDPLTFPTNPSSSSSPITVPDQLDSHLQGPASHIGSASGSYSNKGLLAADTTSPINIDVEQKKFQELAKGETALGGSTKEVTETQINEESTTAISHGNVNDSCTEQLDIQGTDVEAVNLTPQKKKGSNKVMSKFSKPTWFESWKRKDTYAAVSAVAIVCATASVVAYSFYKQRS